MKQIKRLRRGLTLIELLIVVTILAILMIVAAISYQLQHARGLDARRKSDIAKLKVVFEDYYNDKGCYPTAVMMSHCGQGDLRPYAEKVPCDPGTKQPYPYYVDGTCTYYALFTTLGDTSDPVIAQLGCSPTCLVGYSYNYGVTNGSSSLASLAALATIGGVPAPTPTPPPPGSAYACSPAGQCNIYSNPQTSGCPTTYSDPASCQQACSNPANRCAQ